MNHVQVIGKNADFLGNNVGLQVIVMARSSDSIFPLSILKDKTFQAREIRRVLALATVYLVVTTVLMGVLNFGQVSFY